MGLGIDNVALSRITDDILRRFPKRILSDREYEEFESTKNKREYLASRFAGKEAFIKATSNKKIKLADVEILNDSDGKPHIYYKNKECGLISITHDIICTVIVITA